MRKISKTFIVFSLLGISLCLLVFAFVSQKKNPAEAQEPRQSPPMVCDVPIPIGEASELVSGILETVYKEFKDSQTYVGLGISHLQKMVGELNMYPSTICDFSRCSPQVANMGPSLELWITAPLMGGKKATGICAPVCKPLSCGGDPCPDLGDERTTINNAAAQVNSSYEIIHNIFEDYAGNPDKVPVTEDIRYDGEPANQTITKFEQAMRKIKLARLWLHAGSIINGMNSCVLTEKERRQVADGQLGDRYQIRCADALEQGIYWPKAWSIGCANVCDEGPTEDCTNCLVSTYNSEHSSPLGKINYRIYGVCQSLCQDELTPECLNCLCCEDFQGGVCSKPLSEEKCVSWLCGGSNLNWVCCHETPLETD